MSDQKIFCGSGRQKQIRDYPPFYSVTLNLSELGNAVRAGYGWKDNDGNQMIKIDLVQRREPSRSGSTHYATVDTWRPDKGNNGNFSVPQNGHNQNGSFATKGGPAPQQASPREQQRSQGFENYQPPSQSASQYEDDIPF